MKFKLISSVLVAFIALLGLAFLPSAWGAAQVFQRTGPDAGAEINVTADKLSTGDGGGQIEASGNVEIKRQEMRLKADEVRMNRTTQDVEAKGRISVQDPEWKVKSADSIKMNLEKETGELENADIFLEQGHVSLSGRRFQKFGGQTYHVDDGFFTTCLCESGSPSWKFSAQQMDLSLEGTGTIRNGYFYIMDVPVLYIPYGFFPLRTERQTGLLFPKFGHSTREGFRFQQPFFWAVSKSTDTTVAFDVESRARIGVLGEFRTLFEKDSDFKLHASYFNEGLRRNEQRAVVDRTIADQDIPKNRWSIIGTHRYATPAEWLTFSDFAAYRDDLFTRELVERFDFLPGQEADIRRSRYGESRFGVFRNWGDTFVKGEWNFYQDFIQPDAATFHRTPQLAFWGRRFLADFPLEFRWRADGVNYLRREGSDGLRLDLRPEIIVPFRLASALFGSLSVAPRETVYHLYSAVKSSDHNQSRELVEIRANVGSSLSRLFEVDSLGLSRVKHVVEPEVSYLFIPHSDQSRIPIMDSNDRVNRRNLLTFALNNRLWGKSVGSVSDLNTDKNVEYLSPIVTGDVREMASLRMALSYDLDKERKGGDSLSDLDLRLSLRPLPFIDLGLIAGLNPGPWQVSQTRASFAISDPRPMARRALDPEFNRPNSLDLSYHFLRRGPNSFLADDANIDLDAPANCVVHLLDPRCVGTGFNKNTVGNVVAGFLYHVTDNVLVNFSSTYDARDNRFIGFRAISKLLSFCECWTLTFGVKHDVNPSKTSFSFDFNLLGLGNTKSSVK